MQAPHVVVKMSRRFIRTHAMFYADSYFVDKILCEAIALWLKLC